MKIGIIGTGRMGKVLGRALSQKGHSICFGSRDAATGARVSAEIGRNTTGGDMLMAVASAETIIWAVPWYAATDVIRAIGEQMAGKILIDPINPLRSTGSLAIGHKTSAAEWLQGEMPRAKVVKAFNHIYWENVTRPSINNQAVSLFYCSNYDDAKHVAHQLASDIGFAPVDAGPLKNARLLEPLAVLWLQLAFNMHLGTDMGFHLLQAASSEATDS